MKQKLYTCCRCGYEEHTKAEDFDPPFNWA